MELELNIQIYFNDFELSRDESGSEGKQKFCVLTVIYCI